MSNEFYPLQKPHKCKDILGRDIYRVQAALINDKVFYLHEDGVVKDSTLPWSTTADYLTKRAALAAIASYYKQ